MDINFLSATATWDDNFFAACFSLVREFFCSAAKAAAAAREDVIWLLLLLCSRVFLTTAAARRRGDKGWLLLLGRVSSSATGGVVAIEEFFFLDFVLEGLGTFSWLVYEAALARLLAKKPGIMRVAGCLSLVEAEVGREDEDDWTLDNGDRTCSVGASRGEETFSLGGRLEEDFLLDLLVVAVVVLDLDCAPRIEEDTEACEETIPKAFESLSRDGTPFLLGLLGTEEVEGGPTIGLIFLLASFDDCYSYLQLSLLFTVFGDGGAATGFCFVAVCYSLLYFTVSLKGCLAFA